MTAAALGAYIVFEDEAGFSMTPPQARTWGRRGHMPVVRVRGRSWRRWSIAAMCCYKSVSYVVRQSLASTWGEEPGVGSFRTGCGRSRSR